LGHFLFLIVFTPLPSIILYGGSSGCAQKKRAERRSWFSENNTPQENHSLKVGQSNIPEMTKELQLK
jgi:hypothetical protein